MASAPAEPASAWLCLVGERALVPATASLVEAFRARGLVPSFLNPVAETAGPRRLPLTGATPQSPLQLEGGRQALTRSQLARWSIDAEAEKPAADGPPGRTQVGVLLVSPSLGEPCFPQNPPEFLVFVGQSYSDSRLLLADAYRGNTRVLRISGDGAGVWGPLCDWLAVRR